MKPKLSQPTGVCCYCVLSESQCSATPVSSIFFFPFVFFACGIYIFFSSLGNNLFFCESFFFHLVTCNLFNTTNPHFQSHVASQPPREFTSLREVATFLGQILHVSVFSLKKAAVVFWILSWLVSKAVELRKGNTKTANAHGRRDQGKKENSVISTIHNPYLKTRWGLTSPAVNSPSRSPPLE